MCVVGGGVAVVVRLLFVELCVLCSYYMCVLIYYVYLIYDVCVCVFFSRGSTEEGDHHQLT